MEKLHTDFVPARSPIGRRLMVVLHGLGDSMEGYRFLPRAMNLPWLNYLLVNAPDLYFNGFSWYDLYNDSGVGITRSRKLLFKLIDDLRAEGYASEDIVLFGFSQGCLMSIELGTRYPARFAGIVGVSGYVHQSETLVNELSSAAKQQRFLITHGTVDRLLPLQFTRRQIQLLEQAGLKISWREFEKEHTIAGEEEFKVIREFIRESWE